MKIRKEPNGRNEPFQKWIAKFFPAQGPLADNKQNWTEILQMVLGDRSKDLGCAQHDVSPPPVRKMTQEDKVPCNLSLKTLRSHYGFVWATFLVVNFGTFHLIWQQECCILEQETLQSTPPPKVTPLPDPDGPETPKMGRWKKWSERNVESPTFGLKSWDPKIMSIINSSQFEHGAKHEGKSLLFLGTQQVLMIKGKAKI